VKLSAEALDAVRASVESGMDVERVAEMFKVHPATVYRHLARLRDTTADTTADPVVDSGADSAAGSGGERGGVAAGSET
jgi:transposase